MGNAPGSSAEPVFIVCNARSGSTLLRYLLDAHPDIACPAENKVAALARNVLRVHRDLSGDAVTELDIKKGKVPRLAPESFAAARDAVTGMISEYLARRGKTVWCDKSLETIPSLDIIPRIFPKARYICLHRHGMDVVASLLEACRWGYSYFAVQPYVERHYNNIPYGLADYWTSRTKTMVALQESSAQTHAVHYEHLVRDPENTLAGILEFLSLAHDDKLIRRMIEEAFRVEHEPGAADFKIAQLNAVEQRSVERGRAVPEDSIKPPLRDEMNSLLAKMRYPVVDKDWNVSSDIGDDVDRTLLTAAPVAGRLGALIDVLAPRLAVYEGPVIRPVRLTITYGDGDRAHWIIDSSAKAITRAVGDVPQSPELVTRSEVLQAIVAGGLPVQMALGRQMLALRDTADEGEERALERFLTALLVA
jgi:hypothetical protein